MANEGFTDEPDILQGLGGEDYQATRFPHMTPRLLSGNAFLQPNDLALVDSSGGAFNLALPHVSTLKAGQACVVFDVAGACATNNVTVQRNGATINGQASDYSIATDYVQVWFFWTGSTWDVSKEAQSDPNAIHVNVAGEIQGITEQNSVNSADLFLLETSAGAAKRRITGLNLSSVLYLQHRPCLMRYDGATGYYSGSFTSVGNKVMAVLLLQPDVNFLFSDNSIHYLMDVSGSGGGNNERLRIRAYGNAHSNSNLAGRLEVFINSSAGGIACNLFSTGFGAISTGLLFFSYDGDNGTAIFTLDGSNFEDAAHPNRTAPSVATLSAGAGTLIAISRQHSAASGFYPGAVGMTGYDDAYQTNDTDFGTHKSPGIIDERNWTQFGGSAPVLWNPHGQADNNVAGTDLTKNGRVELYIPTFDIQSRYAGIKI